jgi:hypothetical protein
MTRVKRIKLELDEEIEFPILGISTALNDYRLAWLLNENLDLSFQKENNVFTLPNKKKELKSYEYYLHQNEDDLSKFILVKNSQQGSVLFSDSEKLDFFLVLRENYIHPIEELIRDLRMINGIVAIFPFSSSEFEFSEYLND